MTLLNQKIDIPITAEPTLTPSLCKFTLDRILYDGSFNCKSKEMAQGSPLLENLFSLPEIREILVVQNTLTVATHDPKPDWRIIGKKIGTIIRSEIMNGVDLVPKSYVDFKTNEERKTPSPSPSSHSCASHDHNHEHHHISSPSANLLSPEAMEIQKLLEEQINPAVASHGGRITLVDFKDESVYLKMEGGCQGCGQASLTLRQGVERAIKQAIPTIKNVIDVTDHERGINPYY